MRPHLSLLVLTSAAAGCGTWPGFDRPQAEAGGYVALYKLGGRAQMQSPDPNGPVDNPNMRLTEFGARRRDEGVGAFVAVGDGFSGLDLNYLKLDVRDTKPGQLTYAYGNLTAGDLVTTEIQLDEWRLRYLAKLFEHTFDKGIRIEAGIGAAFAHRRLEFFPKKDTGEGQNLIAEDHGVPYLAGRLRGTSGPVSLNLDWAWIDGIDFGGEFEGRMQDVELTGRYEFGAQDATVFIGYRFGELPAKGSEKGLAYRADLRLEGYLLGMQVRF